MAITLFLSKVLSNKPTTNKKLITAFGVLVVSISYKAFGSIMRHDLVFLATINVSTRFYIWYWISDRLEWILNPKDDTYQIG